MSSPPPLGRTLARPKSRIFAWPRLVTNRFAGLMSRWTMPAACAASSASAISIAERQQQIDLERAPGDAMLQRRPVEELHDEERAAVLLADVVDGADVGVVQRRRGPRLAAESGQGLGIVGEVWRQELQRDEALQPRILGFVDHAHPAAAQLLDDAVVRERLTDQRIAAGLAAVVAALVRRARVRRDRSPERRGSCRRGRVRRAASGLRAPAVRRRRRRCRRNASRSAAGMSSADCSS